jgi:DNA-binding MarR family transcriptional regulator
MRGRCTGDRCICIYGVMDKHFIPELPCLCGSLRRAARALTNRYEKELRPLGLRGTQLTILQVLARAGELLQGRLGAMLAMDSTSLTRTLRIMVREGWVAERRGSDRRERYLRLAEEGAELLARASPVWDRVQEEVRSELGDEEWDRLMQAANRVTRLARGEGEKE